MAIETKNPANGKTIRIYDEFSTAKLESILKNAVTAFDNWKETGFEERSNLFKRLAELMKEKKKILAEEITLEMGKPIKQSISEIEKCAWVCNYCAENAKAFLQDDEISTEYSKSFVSYLPLGVILAIMPWNFPYWQLFRFASPALMAGNTTLLKHAPITSGCALTIEKLFIEAGFPEGVLTTILVNEEMTGDLIEDNRIAGVTLTGSTRAGKAVAQKAGAYLKKTVLELGGSDAYVILDDADLNTAAETCVTSRLLNSGQSCIAAKRFIVHTKIIRLFQEKILEIMKSKNIGDPNNEKTDVGPVARYDLLQNLHRQVRDSIDKGAKCLLGGSLISGKGFYYPPTILTDVKPGMPAFDEELFGPVAAIIEAENEDEAIKLANQSSYGLGAAVFTQDKRKGEHIASKLLNAGCCFVNDFVKSDPRLPFGGIKESGYGRELSYPGLREFTNIKTVVVK